MGKQKRVGQKGGREKKSNPIRPRPGAHSRMAREFQKEVIFNRQGEAKENYHDSEGK